jgi:hypothetical protein
MLEESPSEPPDQATELAVAWAWKISRDLMALPEDARAAWIAAMRQHLADKRPSAG